MMPANNHVVRRGQKFKKSETVVREQDANKYGTACGYPIEMSDRGHAPAFRRNDRTKGSMRLRMGSLRRCALSLRGKKCLLGAQ